MPTGTGPLAFAKKSFLLNPSSINVQIRSSINFKQVLFLKESIDLPRNRNGLIYFTFMFFELLSEYSGHFQPQTNENNFKYRYNSEDLFIKSVLDRFDD